MRQLTCVAELSEWHDVPAPAIGGDGEALVRPLAVARCDIDQFLTAGFFPLQGPYAVGHGVARSSRSATRPPRRGRPARGLSFQLSCGSCGAPRRSERFCEAMPTSRTTACSRCRRRYGGMLSDLIRVPYADAMLQPIPPRSIRSRWRACRTTS